MAARRLLVVGDLVVAGVSGGDGPLRGFLAAYKATTGELAWRFWTVPKRGEPGSETWTGTALETGGGATWLTGSYDPELGLLYWPTGNPYPPTDGDQRAGDDLYTAAVVALDAKTGKLRWYFQFSPHDLHDWDATEPLLLVDAVFQGKERKLLLQANRNGFFYVLDRTNGQFLLGKPFVKRLTWATGIGAGGRPQLVEGNNKPTPRAAPRRVPRCVELRTGIPRPITRSQGYFTSWLWKTVTSTARAGPDTCLWPTRPIRPKNIFAPSRSRLAG